MINIDITSLIGKKFYRTTDPNIDYVCLGAAQNDTFLVVGVDFDTTNNRSTLKTFKFQEVIFKNDIRPLVKS